MPILVSLSYFLGFWSEKAKNLDSLKQFVSMDIGYGHTECL